VSLFDRLRSFFSAPTTSPPSEAEPASVAHEASAAAAATATLTTDEIVARAKARGRPAETEPADLRLLTGLTKTDGAPTEGLEALEALRALRGTSHERAALRAVLGAHAVGRAPDDLVLEAARVFLARGEPASAHALLERSQGVAALLLRAEAEESLGDAAAARATLEHVLAQDIDAVGVRERLLRLRREAGLVTHVPLAALPTMTTAEEARATFRIVAEIGRGGASAVFRAEDLLLGRTVALKVFHHPNEHRAQLLREAELAARARGAHVVRVFDVDPEQGFLAMELAKGGALRRLLRGTADERAAGPPVESWLAGLVQALARVHGVGLVHGDVKAANVLFRADGTALLADFGLARAPGEPYEGGTPGTLSPERVRDGVAHEDDDVYALGVLVGEALSRGAPTLTASSADELRRLADAWTAPRGRRPLSARALTWPS
jgi:serine/threonine-protein kinase